MSDYYGKEVAQLVESGNVGGQLQARKGEQPTPLEQLKAQQELHNREGVRLAALIAFVEKNPEMVEQMQALRRYL